MDYDVLERALRALGFRKHSVEGGIVYDHPDSEALLALPALPAHQSVLPRHLAAARSEVVGMGVADEAAFERALSEAATSPLHLIAAQPKF